MTLEYRSSAAWRGLPLVHVQFGMREAGGRYRPGRPRGVIAVGDIAVGAVAVGPAAVGVVAVGAAAFGIVTVGAAALGVMTVGVAAVGVIAVGVAALGVLAVGVVSLGWHAVGIVTTSSSVAPRSDSASDWLRPFLHGRARSALCAQDGRARGGPGGRGPAGFTPGLLGEGRLRRAHASATAASPAAPPSRPKRWGDGLSQGDRHCSALEGQRWAAKPAIPTAPLFSTGFARAPAPHLPTRRVRRTRVSTPGVEVGGRAIRDPSAEFESRATSWNPA